jgi:aminodeoxyfutalosine synthase
MLKPAEERLSPDEALDLLCHGDTAELMMRADRARRQWQGDHVYFVHSLNINPTNICENQCGLCAFWRDTDADDAYSLDLNQITERLHRAKGWALKDLHVVGG